MLPDTPSIRVGSYVTVWFQEPVHELYHDASSISGAFLAWGPDAIYLGPDMLHPWFVIPVARVAYVEIEKETPNE